VQDQQHDTYAEPWPESVDSPDERIAAEINDYGEADNPFGPARFA
jgi:hypothetical protein